MAARPPPRPAPPPARAYPPAQAYRPPPPPLPPEPGPGFHMSGTEALHLLVSVVGLSIAFAFAFSHASAGILVDRPEQYLDDALRILPNAAVVVVLGFLLHEMAHKVVAQRLNLWAEFRASIGGLAAALGLCFFTTIIFAAPGAVLIVGNATRRDGALISIAGPATNLVIGFAFLPFVGSNPNPAEIGTAGNFFQLAVFVNGLLAMFNMLPFPPLDGSKIVRWNLPVYLALLGLSVLLLLFALRVV